MTKTYQLNTQPIEKSVKTDNLSIHSIFKTLQGEGPFSGQRAVFIRLAGCNLQCPLCFGWSNRQGREPFLTMVDGPKKKMGKAKVGDAILTLDDDGNLAETTITNVMTREVDTWLSIMIEGIRYQVTHEHPFFTNRGMIKAEDLVVGDEILHSEASDVLSWKKRGDRNPMKNPEVAARSTANTDYASVGAKVSDAIAARKAAGLHWGGPMSEEAKERISQARMGLNNPNANENTPINYLALRRSIDQGNEKCQCRECATPDSRLEVHHVDGNHDNDAKGNLSVLCHACHSKHHMRGYNFWTNDNRSDHKSSATARDVYNGRKVNSIKESAGKLEVMNISCHPHNTYLADGMWVHNCDTEYTEGREMMSAADVVDKISGMNDDGLVVITGGEPFRQPQGLDNLVTLLVGRGFSVQIETNGTLPPPNNVSKYSHLWVPLGGKPNPGVVYIVISPKTGKVNADLLARACAFKYVLTYSDVDKDTGLPLAALGHTASPHLARPPAWWDRPVYLQPADHKDEEINAKNLEAVVVSCLNHGYTAQVQLHKYLGLE